MNTYEMTYRTADNMPQVIRFRYKEDLDEMCQFLAKIIASQGVASFPDANDPNLVSLLNFNAIQVKSLSLSILSGDDFEYDT